MDKYDIEARHARALRTPPWLDMARALEGMLNGELGRLDGGLLYRELRDLAHEAGFTRDLTERE